MAAGTRRSKRGSALSADMNSYYGERRKMLVTEHAILIPGKLDDLKELIAAARDVVASEDDHGCGHGKCESDHRELRRLDDALKPFDELEI